jgi:hypothetical protein
MTAPTPQLSIAEAIVQSTEQITKLTAKLARSQARVAELEAEIAANDVDYELDDAEPDDAEPDVSIYPEGSAAGLDIPTTAPDSPAAE